MTSIDTATNPSRLRIDVWSDVVCPWCYLGITYLEQALEQFDNADRVDVVLRSFQLDPDVPVHDDVPLVTRLARKYGTTEDQISRSQEQIRARGVDVGIDFRFDLTARGNTMDAHRLLHRAERFGSARDLKQRLFRAYFTEGEVVGDHDLLRRVGLEAGLDAAEVDEVLEGDVHQDDVLEDRLEARRRGITGVPYFLFDGDLALGGAQPVDRLVRVLTAVWDERVDPGLQTPGAQACGPEGCEA